MDTVDGANGRWHGILPQLGISTRYLTGKHGPCPMCGGKDRWRFDNKAGRGTWFCTRCGAGDGFQLVMKVRGMPLNNSSFAAVAEEVDKVMGNVVKKNPAIINSGEAEARMVEVWTNSVPIIKGDVVMEYLHSRGITLKGIKDVHCGDDVMLALFRDKSSRAAQIHHTYLKDRERRYIHGLTLPAGGAVRLMEYRMGGPLGIAEGIETALSAAQLHNIPCWAALDENHLSSWEPPANVKNIVIFGDNDRSYVGQSAAYALARRLAGRDNPLNIEVRIPEAVDRDWNDVLLARKEKPASTGMLTGHR